MLLDDLILCDEAGGEGGGGGGAPAAGATPPVAAPAAPAASAAPAAGGSKTPGTPTPKLTPAVPGLTPEGAAAATPPVYAPNFKYKVLKEEKELPEWARPFVTNPDLEKNFRDAFERADGLEPVKQHRDALVQENSAMREQWAPVVQNTQRAMAAVEKGDLDTFFEIAGLTEMQVLKYALHRLQLRDNPAALAQHEKARTDAQALGQTQEQLQAAQAQFQQLAVQTRTMQLDTALTATEIATAAKAFDTRVGKPGQFRAEVINRGRLYAAQGVDAPVEQLVSEILQLIGGQGQNPPAPGAEGGQGAAPAGGAEPPQGGQQNKPVLPNVRGKGGSPVKAPIKGTDGLREKGRQLRASGH